VVGTSLVWLLVIWQSRRRARDRARACWDGKEGGGIPTVTSGLPLLSAGEITDVRELEECGSEKDSGTGDSKRSYDNNETNGGDIVDHVIHNFLSARGGMVGDWSVAGTSSDIDTGISSIGDHPSTDQPTTTLHRKGCPKAICVEMTSVTLSVDNPLYDCLPPNHSSRIEEADSSSEIGVQSTVSHPASVISDSVAYCGRFPAQSRSHCPRCGEDKEGCPHSTGSVASSVSSYGGQSSIPSQAVSDNQPITFNTFHPFYRNTNHDRSSISSPPSSVTGDIPVTEPLLLGVHNLAVGGKTTKKRLSAMELPTGETYLTIEQQQDVTGIVHPSDPGQEAKEYRGGAGTLPKNGLRQEWLEASIACSSDTGANRRGDSKGITGTGKDVRSSGRRKSSMFRNSKRFSMEKTIGGTLPRRRSIGKEQRDEDSDRTNVVNKDKDMF